MTTDRALKIIKSEINNQFLKTLATAITEKNLDTGLQRFRRVMKEIQDVLWWPARRRVKCPVCFSLVPVGPGVEKAFCSDSCENVLKPAQVRATKKRLCRWCDKKYYRGRGLANFCKLDHRTLYKAAYLANYHKKNKKKINAQKRELI